MTLPGAKRGQGFGTGLTAAGELLTVVVTCALAEADAQSMAVRMVPTFKQRCTKVSFCIRSFALPPWVGVKRVYAVYLSYLSG